MSYAEKLEACERRIRALHHDGCTLDALVGWALEMVAASLPDSIERGLLDVQIDSLYRALGLELDGAAK